MRIGIRPDDPIIDRKNLSSEVMLSMEDMAECREPGYKPPFQAETDTTAREDSEALRRQQRERLRQIVATTLAIHTAIDTETDLAGLT